MIENGEIKIGTEKTKRNPTNQAEMKTEKKIRIKKGKRETKKRTKSGAGTRRKKRNPSRVAA